jgi:hypothetical protein
VGSVFYHGWTRTQLTERLRAHDTEPGGEVALREIRPRFADDPMSLSRVEREAEVTGRLEHRESSLYTASDVPTTAVPGAGIGRISLASLTSTVMPPNGVTTVTSAMSRRWNSTRSGPVTASNGSKELYASTHASLWTGQTSVIIATRVAIQAR